MQQETGERNEVQGRQHRGQAFIIARQPPEAGQPRKTAHDHPTTGQEHKAPFGLGQANHFQSPKVSTAACVLDSFRRLCPL